MKHEPMEHIMPDSGEYVRWDDRAEALTREYRAGFRVGLVNGLAAGIILVPAAWVGLVWLGA